MCGCSCCVFSQRFIHWQADLAQACVAVSSVCHTHWQTIVNPVQASVSVCVCVCVWLFLLCVFSQWFIHWQADLVQACVAVSSVCHTAARDPGLSVSLSPSSSAVSCGESAMTDDRSIAVTGRKGRSSRVGRRVVVRCASLLEYHY